MTEEIEADAMDFLAEFEAMVEEDNEHVLETLEEESDPTPWEVVPTFFEESFDLNILRVAVVVVPDENEDEFVVQQPNEEGDSEDSFCFEDCIE